jgi:[acyl-carrier-protein] S-malonyltransferase
MPTAVELRNQMYKGAYAFRGYNVTNLGRSAELLTHKAYGPIVESFLRDASEVCSEAVKRPIDLAARIRAARETESLADYPEDVALILAMELAQLRLLEQFHGIALSQARLAFGYSLGESAALIGAGVYAFRDFLAIPLAMAEDCAALAQDVTLAILFSRGPVLDFDSVHKLCLEISQEGKGVIDVSTYLSPNSVLLMGQNGTMTSLETRVHDLFPKQVHVRRHQHRYPPLHTPIMWQRNIPNRAAVMMQRTPGGMRKPSIPILSMVTGSACYGEFNSRDIMHQWIDHPQKLWDVMYKVLGDGVETVIHVGPEPNLLPATFNRLANNITAQTKGRGLGSLGRRTISRLVRRPWLTRLLPSSSVLFRAPFLKHIILEDWLLEQKV